MVYVLAKRPGQRTPYAVNVLNLQLLNICSEYSLRILRTSLRARYYTAAQLATGD